MTGELDPILRSQVEYYRARAGEYDDWFARRGRYDRGPRATETWFTEIDEVRRSLDALEIDGADILELAPGTGIWTEMLLERAGTLTAIDASPEMIEQAKSRLGARAAAVTFLVDDLFTWTPPRQFDAVVACFWISHVPNAMLDDFLGRVAAALVPGGTLFMLDARKVADSTAVDHELPEEGVETMIRRLDDGREYSIIKNFWSPDELRSRCAKAGLDVEVFETSEYFEYVIGRRLSST